MTETKRYWLIRGYRDKKICEHRIPLGQISEKHIGPLLMTLAATMGHLTANEIIGAYARKRTKIYNRLLAVTREKPYCRFRCGDDPCFIAEAMPRPVVKTVGSA